MTPPVAIKRLEGSMSKTHSALVATAMALGYFVCAAQDVCVPIRQMNEEAQLSARSAAPASEIALARSFEMSGASSSSASFVLVPSQNKFARTANIHFFVLNGVHLGMAMFDVAMTQHCLADHHCVEGNPLMPSSVGGQLGVNFALVGFGALSSYKLKKDDSKLWGLSPIVGIIAHTLGVATGFAHR
jgi:hypothetical protein